MYPTTGLTWKVANNRQSRNFVCSAYVFSSKANSMWLATTWEVSQADDYCITMSADGRNQCLSPCVHLDDPYLPVRMTGVGVFTYSETDNIRIVEANYRERIQGTRAEGPRRPREPCSSQSSTPSFTHAVGWSSSFAPRRLRVHVVTVKAKREHAHVLVPGPPQQQHGSMLTSLTALDLAAPMFRKCPRGCTGLPRVVPREAARAEDWASSLPCPIGRSYLRGSWPNTWTCPQRGQWHPCPGLPARTELLLETFAAVLIMDNRHCVPELPLRFAEAEHA